MTTDADDGDLMMVDLSQGRKRLQRWDGDLVPWGWTGVKQNVYKCANFGHFWQNTSRLSSRRFLSLRRRGWSWSPTWSTCSGRSWRRMNGEMKMIMMTKEIITSITFFSEFTVTFKINVGKIFFLLLQLEERIGASHLAAGSRWNGGWPCCWYGGCDLWYGWCYITFNMVAVILDSVTFFGAPLMLLTQYQAWLGMTTQAHCYCVLFCGWGFCEG